jgi:NADH dehydrogenase [ubiquinone] 1 alpha subcomplex assembly factor 7
VRLLDALRERIAAEGPMPVADYMAACLREVYESDAIGAGGHFTTAPEISQMFGELVGLCLAQAWLDQGAPGGVVLAELGPGRGTLMADLLRATKGVPGFHEALSVHLVEASRGLRAEQAARVSGATWHDEVGTLPEGPLLLVANEFLDALPVRQMVRRGDLWAERVVRLEGEALAFGEGEPGPCPGLAGRDDVPEGGVVELRPEADRVGAEIGRRIAAQGGCALLIDYGDRRSVGDTLQAVARHAYADVLAEPGALAAALAPARALGAIPQGLWLERLGIGQRAERLGEAALAARRRLVSPHEMGALFKVMAAVPEGAPLPAGF